MYADDEEQRKTSVKTRIFQNIRRQVSNKPSMEIYEEEALDEDFDDHDDDQVNYYIVFFLRQKSLQTKGKIYKYFIRVLFGLELFVHNH